MTYDPPVFILPNLLLLQEVNALTEGPGLEGQDVRFIVMGSFLLSDYLSSGSHQQ